MKFVQQKNKFRMWLSIGVALLLIFAYFNASDPASEPLSESTQSIQQETITREGLLTETNKIREADTPLTADPVLEDTAQSRCEEMAALDKFEHLGLQEMADRLNRHVGENLTYGSRTSSQVVANWLRSPEHHKNMVDRDFSRVGFGICPFRGETLVVQHLSN